MISAATITDAQILEMRETGALEGDRESDAELRTVCNLALLAPSGVGRKHEYEVARARCAMILNARACLDHWHCDPTTAPHDCTKIDRSVPCPSCRISR